MDVAVLGVGRAGNHYVDVLKQDPLVGRIIGHDINEETLRSTREKKQIETTGNLGDILSDAAVKLVLVSATNNAHKDLAIQALNAGKAVMCEKPMANSLEDSLEIVETAERRRGFLQVGFECRYSKLYMQVKKWIEEGYLGDVVNTCCDYRLGFKEKESWRNKKAICGSMFGEKLSHYVDLPRWWIGSPVTDVYARSSPNLSPYCEVHDNYYATYSFANGAASNLTYITGAAATFMGDPLRNEEKREIAEGHALRYMVFGTKGAAETDVFARTIKRFSFVDTPTGYNSVREELLTWPPDEDHAYYHNTTGQTHDIVYRVSHGLPPKTPARDAFETMRLCFAIEESVDSGKIITLGG